MSPGVTLLFGLSAKWTALIFLSIQLLSCLAEHAWGQLIHSLASAGFAFAYIRIQQGRWDLPSFSMPKKRPSLKVMEAVPVQKKGASATFRVVREEPDALDLIDPLLEKIGRTGMASLTEKEKAQLEHARSALMRKEQTRS
jgi:hypothetical protein